MKLKSSFFFMLMLLFMTSFSQSVNAISDPVKYNDFIIKQQDDIGVGINALVLVVNDISSTKIQSLDTLNVLLKTIDTGIKNLSALTTLDPDFGFKDNTIALFRFYKRIVDDQYRKMIDEFYSDAPDVDEIERLQKEIEAEEAGLDAEFLGSQKKFAEYYGITLY